MSEFKSHRFGNVETYQAGAWGTPGRWEFARDGVDLGICCHDEPSAIFAGLLLANITDEQYQAALTALPQYMRKEAAE